MKKSSFALAALGLVLAAPAFGFDWGGSVEDTTASMLPMKDLKTGTLNQTETLRFWVSQNFGRDASVLLKGNVANATVWSYGSGFQSNTPSGDLDTLTFTGYNLVIGRTTFRDFGATVLNTTLDGLQYSLSTPGIDFTLAAGTSAAVFQDQSTIVISQADLTDRSAGRDWSKPRTYLAPPRAIAYVETDFTRLVDDQTFRVAGILQYDLRKDNVAVDGGKYDQFKPNQTMANVSMVYTGLGGGGRVVGSLYWDAWTYVGFGTSLTATGPFSQGVYDAATKKVGPDVAQTWKNSSIVNGIANIDLTLLVPELNYTIVNLGVQGGSWDPDGISPDQNQPTVAKGDTPSLYTGYFGVSRTGGSLVFSPQPVNMVITQLLYSIKPFANDRGPLGNFQVAASGFVFVRPTAGAIAETGLDTKSSDRYVASEADVNLMFRPASDWGGNLNLGVMVPGAALTRGIESKVQLGLNLSF